MSEEKKIKVVLLEPGKLARTAEIDASLAGMQKVVGGLIEPFYPFEEQVCIVCNEESKINGMRPNRSVKNDDGVMVDFIFGPAFICDCRGENLDSLSDEQIDRYGKMFRYPEHLARVNDTLLGIPYRPQPERERGYYFGRWQNVRPMGRTLCTVPASIAVVIPQRHLSGVAPENLSAPSDWRTIFLYPKGGHSR